MNALSFPEQYRRDGFVVVPGLFDQAEMAHWAEVLRPYLAADSGHRDTGVRVWRVEEFPPELLPAMTGQPLAEVLLALLGSGAAFLSAKAVYKDAAVRFASPWHQDWPYWRGSPKLSVWIALTDVDPTNGCLRVIPGTHTRHFAHVRVAHDNGFENRIAAADLQGLPVRDVPLAAGAALFFSDLLVHASHPNHSGRPRPSLIATYRDSTMPDDAQVWSTALPLAGSATN